jgi:hypothetical protein
MHYIKSINESLLNKAYVVVRQRENDSDFFKSVFIVMDDLKYFTTYEKAADHLIKELNKYHGQNFEPMMEGDNRLFINAKDNPDLEKALKYCKEKLDGDIYIKEITIE